MEGMRLSNLIKMLGATLVTVVFIFLGSSWVSQLSQGTHQRNELSESLSESIQTSVEDSEETSLELGPLEYEFLYDGLEKKEQTEELASGDNTLILRSVGDILVHDRVSYMADTDSDLYNDSVNKLLDLGYEKDFFSQNAVYDFSPMFAYIHPYTDYADVTVANLEVIAASPQLPMNGYPNFNAPKEILSSLKNIGIDILSAATNHTLDWSSQGVYYSLENIQEAGLMYYGSFESWEDYQTPRIIEANGISLGFLSYSYGTNGIPVPAGEEYLINLIDLPIMLKEVEQLSEEVDAIVVSLQLGGEYDSLPNPEQFYIFQALADAGVKLILGGHPHVPQPFDWYNDGDTLAIYSQASFLTGQRELENKVGGILEATFVKDSEGMVDIVSPKYMPIFNLGVEAEKMYQVVPMADIEYHQIPDGQNQWNSISSHMSYYMDDLEIVTHLETKSTYESSKIFR